MGYGTCPELAETKGDIGFHRGFLEEKKLEPPPKRWLRCPASEPAGGILILL